LLDCNSPLRQSDLKIWHLSLLPREDTETPEDRLDDVSLHFRADQSEDLIPLSDIVSLNWGRDLEVEDGDLLDALEVDFIVVGAEFHCPELACMRASGPRRQLAEQAGLLAWLYLHK
jgi:hypothetical protein